MIHGSIIRLLGMFSIANFFHVRLISFFHSSGRSTTTTYSIHKKSFSVNLVTLFIGTNLFMGPTTIFMKVV